MKELCPGQGAPVPPDFRALCAELLAELENAIRVIYHEDGTRHVSSADPVITKADAALAQPVPPSLKEQALEILNLGHEGWGLANDDWQTLRRALEALPE